MPLFESSQRRGLGFQFRMALIAVVFFLSAAFLLLEIYVPYILVRQVDETSSRLSQSIALRIDQELADTASSVEAMAARAEIITMDKNVQDPVLILAKELNPYMTRLLVIDKDGKVTTLFPEDPVVSDKNYANAIYFRKAIETNKTYYSDVFVENKEIVTLVATPIRAEDGSIIGTLNVVVSLSRGAISDYLAQLNLGAGGYAVLVDKRGTLAIHPDQKRVERQENIRDFESVKRVLSGEVGNIVCGFDGQDRLCSYAPVNRTGWGIIVTRSVNQVYPYLIWIRIGFGVLFLIGIGLVISFFLHGRRYVLAPVAELTKGVHNVTDGDFDYKVAIDRPIEMAELAGAFNNMTDVLATYYSVTTALNSMASLTEIEDYVLEKMDTVFKTEASSIMRFVDNDMLTIMASRGIPEEAVAAHNERRTSRKDFEHILGKKIVMDLEYGQSVLLKSSDLQFFSDVIPVEQIKYYYVFPLLIKNRLDGVLMALSSSETPFTTEHVRTIQGIAGHIAMAIQRSDLYDSLYLSYAQTTKAIARAIDAKDPYNQGHSDAVAGIAVKIAQKMGLSIEATHGIEIAAYLHDIGKIGIGEDLLKKPAQLSQEEKEIINKHPVLGTEILEPITFPWPVLDAVEHHHERFDGTGYPGAVDGEHISLEARILAIADAYVSMISDHPYRSALTREEIITEIIQGSGRQFDPDVSQALLEIIDEEEARKKKEDETLEEEEPASEEEIDKKEQDEESEKEPIESDEVVDEERVDTETGGEANQEMLFKEAQDKDKEKAGLEEPLEEENLKASGDTEGVKENKKDDDATKQNIDIDEQTDKGDT